MVKDNFKTRFQKSLNSKLNSDKDKCYFKDKLTFFIKWNKDRYLNNYDKFFFSKFLDKYDLEAINFFLKDETDRNQLYDFIKQVIDSINVSDTVYKKYLKSLEINDEE